MAQWLMIWVFSVEIPGLNPSQQLSFLCTFLPCSDCSIRVILPHDLQLFGFCLVTL